jgi:hypothetical protein
MWTVEMENASIINIVGMENVIMVKQLKRAQKNVTNIVEMVYVVPWRIVRIVRAIVECANHKPHVETIFVKWEKHVIHVRVIVDVIQTAAMVPVRIQLGKIVYLVQGIVERAHQIQFVVTVHVMGMKHVVLVQEIVASALSFVAMVYVMDMNYAVRVLEIVERVYLHLQTLIAAMDRVMEMKIVIYVPKIVEIVLLQPEQVHIRLHLPKLVHRQTLQLLHLHQHPLHLKYVHNACVSTLKIHMV